MHKASKKKKKVQQTAKIMRFEGYFRISHYLIFCIQNQTFFSTKGFDCNHEITWHIKTMDYAFIVGVLSEFEEKYLTIFQPDLQFLSCYNSYFVLSKLSKKCLV